MEGEQLTTVDWIKGSVHKSQIYIRQIFRGMFWAGRRKQCKNKNNDGDKSLNINNVNKEPLA